MATVTFEGVITEVLGWNEARNLFRFRIKDIREYCDEDGNTRSRVNFFELRSRFEIDGVQVDGYIKAECRIENTTWKDKRFDQYWIDRAWTREVSIEELKLDKTVLANNRIAQVHDDVVPVLYKQLKHYILGTNGAVNASSILEFALLADRLIRKKDNQ